MNPYDTQQKQDSVSAQPVSAGNKEMEMPKMPEAGMEDPVEFAIPKEVTGHVQISQTTPEIPPDLKQAGVTYSPSDQTMSNTSSSGNSSRVMLTDDQINDGLTKKPTDSFRWLAEWCIKQLKLAHVHFKKINGRYIRITDHITHST